MLEQVNAGDLTVDAALEGLRDLPYENLGHARLDHHRALRTGVPEVVFGRGKSPEQVSAAFAALARKSERVLATSVEVEAAEKTLQAVPEATYRPDCRMLLLDRKPRSRAGAIAVICAGTADIPVAEEAALTAETMGSCVERFWDVGVAGVHRLLDIVALLRQARAVVAVAGMEGALPSVTAGLLSAPVVAVPTSVGYGASLGGVAALLAMLNSCAPGVSVVNIDNGFGAGVVAHLINLDHTS